MSRFKRLYKKYERHFLLGIVIILLASFSITGAFSCQDRGQAATYKMGGEFNVAPGVREEVGDKEFDRIFAKYYNFQNAIRMPSQEFNIFLAGLRPQPDQIKPAWASILTLAAAQHAGYHAGDHQVRLAVRDMVEFALLYRARLPWSESNYQTFLKNNFARGTQAQFQDAVREVVIKDQFLYPIVMTSRYEVPYAEAYKGWRTSRERVDLRYASVSAEPFADGVKKAERTRQVIGRQTEVLTQVTNVSATMRRIQAKIDAHKRTKGSYPKALTDLAAPGQTFDVRDDAWGTAPRYQVVGDTATVRSAGPDKAFDTADDITAETQKQLDTHGNLFQLADKIGQRHTATGAWPTSLDELKQAAGGGDQLPGIVRNIDDGWGQPFEYEAFEVKNGVEEIPPTLTSKGPDGSLGTDDDIRLTLDAERVNVAPGTALAVYVRADLEDAWGHALTVRLTRPQPTTWQVSSAGPDGEAGNEDDLSTGNAQELKLFFSGIRGDYNLPARRRFEALFVHLPLVSDAALKRLWEKYPEDRPTEEDKLFEYWRTFKSDVFYRAKDPRDPKKGYGAELVADIAPEAKPTLVPAADLFPYPLGGKANEPKKDEPGDADPKKADPKKADPKKDGEETIEEAARRAEAERKAAEKAKEAEERTAFREQGWREVVIRELFMEKLLNRLLQQCRDSRLAVLKAEKAHAAWKTAQEKYEKRLAAWEKSDADKPEAERSAKPEAPTAEEPKVPTEITFESLLKGELGTLVASGDENTPPAIQHWVTPELMSREAWEKNKNFGQGLQFELSRLKQDGEYNGIPAQIHRRMTKVLLRRLAYKPQEPQSYEDVKDKVFDRFVLKRQTDRAVAELKRLQREVERLTSELPENAGDAAEQAAEQAAKQAAWTKAVQTWTERTKIKPLVETSGLFIGSVPPAEIQLDDPLYEGTPADEKARIARRNVIWRMGYATVRPVISRQDTVTAEPGTFGRRILRDPMKDGEGTGRAYLIQVAARVYPSKDEFSPRAYDQALGKVVFGDRGRMRAAQRLRDREGRFNGALARWLDDVDWLQVTFDLQTNSEMNTLDRKKR